ncbi:hypothetical protein DERP_004056, partial [Dermatophagoides pteronyssinus]
LLRAVSNVPVGGVNFISLYSSSIPLQSCAKLIICTRSLNLSRIKNCNIRNGVLNHIGADNIKTFFNRPGYAPFKSIVNFPVSNSRFNGSFNGSNLTNPSRKRIVSCDLYNINERSRSNLRAIKNLHAVRGRINGSLFCIRDLLTT